MTKAQKSTINEKALQIWNESKTARELAQVYEGARLFSCSATVYENHRYYVLKSYKTVIAVIDKHTGELADLLRYVYGYTATSAQHISKFARAYRATTTLRYYD